MIGILVVDKPEGFTSFDVVAKLRGICATKRIGHGGTLDPMATGVLPVFVGNAAKAVDLAPRQDKTYEAQILFGVATDTGDITGEVLQSEEVHVTEQELRWVLPKFLGETQQLPPMYSAVKVNGKALYKYAREGKEVERKLRSIVIHSADFLGCVGENRFSVRVHCSKGTYIRTLMEDVGKALGVPATLAALRRTQAGVFDISQTVTLQELQKARDENRLNELFLPIETVFEDYPSVTVSERDAAKLKNGVAVLGQSAPEGMYRVYAQEQFLGLCEVHLDGAMKVKKLFYI